MLQKFKQLLGFKKVYTAKQKELTDYQGTHFSLFEKGKPLTYKQFIQALQSDLEFIGFLNKLLANSPFEAFFWEVKPINHQQLDSPFEFVLIDSQALTRISPKPSAFQSYFTSIKQAVSFLSLGKDAVLISPTPIEEEECYTHLANFTRKAPMQQQVVFWKLVGKEYERAIEAAPKWLSTSGLGVHWLHARIDSRPKYYQYKPYRQHSS